MTREQRHSIMATDPVTSLCLAPHAAEPTLDGMSELGSQAPAQVVYGGMLREAEEGHAMVVTGGIRAALVAVALALVSCGPGTPVRTSPPSGTPTVAPRPSAALGACASVRTTTPIDQVSAACAALWAPYGVTKVPPANLTDSTPVPSAVVNATQGAVSDSVARDWATAVNRTGMWLRWSEANDQYQITSKIESGRVVNATLDSAMRRGVPISDPDCDLFAEQYLLYPMNADGKAFFASFGEDTQDQYVFVEHYSGPCAIVGSTTNGASQTLLSTDSAVVTVSAGTVQHDALLGDIWFGDGAAFCTSRGAPSAWCSR